MSCTTAGHPPALRNKKNSDHVFGQNGQKSELFTPKIECPNQNGPKFLVFNVHIFSL